MEKLSEAIRQERLANAKQIWAKTQERAKLEAEKARVREKSQNMASQKGFAHEASLEPGLGEADLPETEESKLEAAFVDCEKTTGQVTGRLRAKTLIDLAMQYNQQLHGGDRDSVSSLCQRLKNLLQQHNAASPNYTLRILEAGGEVLVSNNAKSLSTRNLTDTETEEPMPDAVRACFEFHAEDLDWIRNKPNYSIEYNEAKSSLNVDINACMRTVAHYSLTPYWRQLVLDRAILLYRLDSRANGLEQTFEQKAAQLLGEDYLEKYGVTTARSIPLDQPGPAANAPQVARTGNMQTPTQGTDARPRIKQESDQTWNFDQGEVVNLVTDESSNEDDGSFHVPAIRKGPQVPKVPAPRKAHANKRPNHLSKYRHKRLSKLGGFSDSDDDIIQAAESRRLAKLRSNAAGPSAEAQESYPFLAGSMTFPEDFSLGKKAKRTITPSQGPVAESTDTTKAVKSEEPGTPGSNSNLRMPTPGLPLDARMPRTEFTSQAPVVENTETTEAAGVEEPSTLASNSNLQVPTSEQPATFESALTEELGEEPTGSASPSQANEQLRYLSSLTENNDHLLTIDRQLPETMDIDDGNDGQNVVSASAEADAPGVQGSEQHGDLNVNDDENEDTWVNPFLDDAGAYSRDASLCMAAGYFDHARIYAKFSKQLDSLDSLIRDTIQPPCAMVVDTLQHFATKEGHSITDLEVLEKAFSPRDGWKELAKSIGPWTGYATAEAKFEEIGEAFMLEVARLAKDMKEPLEMTLLRLRRDLRECTEPFHSRNELARYLENALHNMEAEPGTLEEDYEAMVEDLLRMKETYRNIRKGFTKYKCLARSLREEVAAALRRARGSYNGDTRALNHNDLHALNGDFDYTERWATVGAVMFYRQYQHLQTFIEQADRCDARARDLFLAFQPEDSEEADREEEAELHPTHGLTEENLRRATEGRPEVTAEDEVPDADLIDTVARAASHGEDLEEIEDDLEELAE
ncbi:hypothetical protein D0868_01571 [Hortaea werneckii]|uniref:Uncharacterized protein n=1 Tax=Hortaea werneckii TaxID=91943 RepID=A0A3M6ZGC2_HORWE|nr:hypothetical protein D0868_01571 [Hortaea werneckii]